MILKREDVFVHITSEGEAKELLQVLTESGESAYHDEVLHDDGFPYYAYSRFYNQWSGHSTYKVDLRGKTEVTIPELKQILNTMTYEQQLEQALTELETLKGKVKALLDKPKELVVGRWYKRTDEYNVIACICDTNESNEVNSYGFCNDKWYDDRSMSTHWGYMGQVDDWIEATSKEVKDALVKEAEKRGLIKGSTVNQYSINKEYSDKCFLKDGYFTFNLEHCWLAVDCYTVFENGKWASVIDDNRCELDADIQALKDKYKDFNITVIVE